jgi:hypothetical protein
MVTGGSRCICNRQRPHDIKQQFSLWLTDNPRRHPRYSAVILGLDPRIILSAYWPPSSLFSVVRAVADARVEPEHDAQRKTNRHNENCWI